MRDSRAVLWAPLDPCFDTPLRPGKLLLLHDVAEAAAPSTRPQQLPDLVCVIHQDKLQTTFLLMKGPSRPAEASRPASGRGRRLTRAIMGCSCHDSAGDAAFAKAPRLTLTGPSQSDAASAAGSEF